MARGGSLSRIAAKFPSIALIRYARDQARRTETKRETTENDGVSRAAGGSYRNRCLRDAYRGRMCIAITQIAVLFSPAPGDRLRERERETGKREGRDDRQGPVVLVVAKDWHRVDSRDVYTCIQACTLCLAPLSIDSTSCLSLERMAVVAGARDRKEDDCQSNW